MKTIFLRIFLVTIAFLAPALNAATSITQYGITWTFDKDYPSGQFVTGDYWVLGPVRITGVTPAPGPAVAGASTGTVKSRYGATGMVDDSRMRNGSMIVVQPSSNQGYDSRLINYKPDLSVAFPAVLQTNQSLISTISNDTFPVQVMHEALMWRSEKTAPLALKTAAILTCLSQAPPADAFRPPYAGSEKPIYETGSLKWNILPKLAPAGLVPSWEQFERYLQRPWLDHIPSWLLQLTGPSENQVNYGREFTRITAISSLMLMLDAPRQRKEKLMISLVQLGIDLHGLAQSGREWSADGGHWSGRKWPILFAGLMLGDKEMQTMPPGKPVFAEDQQTYYGQGASGQSALYQMVFHTGPRSPYEEKTPDTWDALDKKSESYRMVNSPAWSETALAVQLMKAKALWNHDAFFDYCDRWMSKADPYAAKRGAFPRPEMEGTTFDPFVDAMWTAYRGTVPPQPGGTQNLKWVWNQTGKTGEFVSNPKDAN